MSQTTAFALKTLVESLGLGVTAYADEPPQGVPKTPRPYVTITEEIALVPDPLEDAAPSTAVETAQVDLWQDWKVRTPGPTEGNIAVNYTLAPALRKGMHGKRLVLIGTAIVYMVRVVHSIRFLEPDSDGVDLLHHAITVEINREL